MRKIINRGGRPATGKVRFKKFVLEMSPDEREYIFRKVTALRKEGANISQTGLILKRVFKSGWKEELADLRVAQRRGEALPFDLSAHA